MSRKTPEFFMRHYGANLPRDARPATMLPEGTLCAETDGAEAEMRVLAWAEGQPSLCKTCGQHANEHGAIGHPFDDGSTPRGRGPT